MSPSPAARPREGRPRRLRSPAGSCTRKRRGFPADGAPGRTFQSRPAPPHRRAPLKGEPHPVDACPFSTDPRPPCPPRREAGPALAGLPTAHGSSPAPYSLPSAGRQVFLRTTRPSTSTTRGTLATAPKLSTPGGPPWEGPQPPSDLHRSGAILTSRTAP